MWGFFNILANVFSLFLVISFLHVSPLRCYLYWWRAWGQILNHAVQLVSDCWLE